LKTKESSFFKKDVRASAYENGGGGGGGGGD
jgi:hypothetical protein